jgi:diacylglycerol kinase family enzyme
VALLLINPRSGNAHPTADELGEAAASLGIATRVLREGDDAAELARAAESGPLGIAGGDGSLAAVAAVAIERGVPFVCIPFGTRNHFARDVGLDRNDPLGALASFSGDERLVDVGFVDGRPFLNNVSLGLYAGLVHRRERHRRRGELLAGLRALKLLAQERNRLHAAVDGEPYAVRVLFVGNNRYELSLFTVGERTALDEGCLHLYAVRSWLPDEWDEKVASEFEIELPPGRVRAAFDGEPEWVDGSEPLVVESRPRALRVLLPSVNERE